VTTDPDLTPVDECEALRVAREDIGPEARALVPVDLLAGSSSTRIFCSQILPTGAWEMDEEGPPPPPSLFDLPFAHNVSEPVYRAYQGLVAATNNNRFF
jgi:hypothetical protein